MYARVAGVVSCREGLIDGSEVGMWAAKWTAGDPVARHGELGRFRHVSPGLRRAGRLL